ncbi:MAG: hypothetical protein R3D01_05365 [Hyphomicrobiales bacterium]
MSGTSQDGINARNYGTNGTNLTVTTGVTPPSQAAAPASTPVTKAVER